MVTTQEESKKTQLGYQSQRKGYILEQSFSEPHM